MRWFLASVFALIPSVAVADTFTTPPDAPLYLTFSLSSQLASGEIFTFPVNYDGGVLEATLVIYDTQLDATMGLDRILSYPAGFVGDPNLASIQQWPWDAMYDIFYLNVDPPAIVTPEPSTILLVGAAFLLCIGLAWKRFMDTVQPRYKPSEKTEWEPW